MISAALSMLKTEGERITLSGIYSENAKRFYAIAYSVLKNSAEAEDAVQEAFLRIAAKPERFFRVSDGKKVAYIDVIVKNVSCDMLEKRTHVWEAELDEEAADSAPSLEELVIGQDSKERLIEFISAMPEGRKQAILLKSYHDMSSAEIADALGISEMAARKRISDAYKAIREFLEKEKQYG